MWRALSLHSADIRHLRGARSWDMGQTRSPKEVTSCGELGSEGGVQGRDPVCWASGRYCSERGVDRLRLEPGCPALPALLGTVPHACPPAVLRDLLRPQAEAVAISELTVVRGHGGLFSQITSGQSAGTSPSG
ncbi:unnamed protein product [Rangifer tarandus platyrhynchus]|uniref:Uncharacterized protein n=1 Tax=Rangifer tarandus platyrhynchus TaxID=3082113 RepID=A0AC59Z703_RANTA